MVSSTEEQAAKPNVTNPAVLAKTVRREIFMAIEGRSSTLQDAKAIVDLGCAV